MQPIKECTTSQIFVSRPISFSVDDEWHPKTLLCRNFVYRHSKIQAKKNNQMYKNTKNHTPSPHKPVSGKIRRLMARGIAFAAICYSLSSGHLQAQLPTLNKAPWQGYFAGYSTSRGLLGIHADGTIIYNTTHKIYPSVQETSADGKVTIHRLMPDTLTTKDQPTDKPKKITYSGKVKNGSTIEVTVDFTRNAVSIGGAITEKVESANSQQFVVYTNAPPYYLMYGEKQTLKNGTPEEKKRVEQAIARQEVIAAEEFLELTRLDGKKIKVPLLDAVDFSKEFNGDGFKSIKADLHWFKNRNKLEITTTEGSRMIFFNVKERPIFKHHYYITWMEEPETKSPGRGRMVVSLR